MLVRFLTWKIPKMCLRWSTLVLVFHVRMAWNQWLLSSVPKGRADFTIQCPGLYSSIQAACFNFGTDWWDRHILTFSEWIFIAFRPTVFCEPLLQNRDLCCGIPVTWHIDRNDNFVVKNRMLYSRGLWANRAYSHRIVKGIFIKKKPKMLRGIKVSHFLQGSFC